MDYKYHPKILKVFSRKELDKIMKNYSAYCVDDDGRVDYILVLTDKLNAEIYIGVNAEDKDHALIYNLNNRDYDEDRDYFGPLDSKKFLEIFNVSKATKITFIEVD